MPYTAISGPVPFWVCLLTILYSGMCCHCSNPCTVLCTAACCSHCLAALTGVFKYADTQQIGVSIQASDLQKSSSGAAPQAYAGAGRRLLGLPSHLVLISINPQPGQVCLPTQPHGIGLALP